MTWPFGSLRQFSYDAVVADPPWSFSLYSDKGEAKSPQAQYRCMDMADIEALPVGHLVGANSWLFLWATAPLLPEAIRVMSAWGFTYKSTIAWRKMTRNGKPAVGPGYIARTMHENVLIGAIGSPEYRKALPSVFGGLRREHSRKPNEFYDLVDRFCSPHARKLDLFSRQTRPGWISWGDQATKFDARPSLCSIAQAEGTTGASPEEGSAEVRWGERAACNRQAGQFVEVSAAGEGVAAPADPVAAPDLFSALDSVVNADAPMFDEVGR